MPVIAEPIENYVSAHSSPEPPWLTATAVATRANTSFPGMLTGHVEGRFLEFLVWALQPKLVVEVGTFTGYGTIAMAAGLPIGGRIITCELDPKHASMAREHVAASPYGDRIEVLEGPALQTLGTIEGPVDFAFIDADKPNYVNYYDLLVPKLSARGVIAIDNVLWSGAVADDSVDDEFTMAMRAFNDRVAADERVLCVMTTVRDGVTLVWKK